ncbi:DUF2334 domain-containing protein [Exiguobacterium sp. SH5S13]|uniref:DUF2334 domain-containing protein n=1 Tax=Exiguobacterium sp. SH5S13 TaxID=2510959 RepID=UPI00103DD928|nr:DUF2334 domain-containing protein [Exiguobacterium sp. SH5S13]TCI53441.1 DUF2334 domain-containing protein [Exiguobacterium sp. SH5S13]
MRYNILVMTCLLLLLPMYVHADEPTTVVIVYSSSDVTVPPDVHKLDALVSKFTDDVRLVRDVDVMANTSDHASHLFYYGVSIATIAEPARDLLNDTDVPVYAIGHNVEQLDAFKQYDLNRVPDASKFFHERTGETVSFELTDVVTTIRRTEDMLVHASLIRDQQMTPVLVQIDDTFYAGVNNLLNRTHLFVADSLFDFFDVEAKPGHVGYLRLEDINPSSDPDLVESVGTYLLDRGVPILLAVIPIYTDAESGQTIQFSERPELVRVLQELEARGATVLAHGYTHQYRSSETGEGFEFWDVENNQPVLVPSNETPPILKSRESFSSESAYVSHRDALLKGETTYIRSKLTNSIHSLVSLGLHPLGFEAPHYTMSHSGYALTAKQFTNVFGQVQWSNTNWQTMSATPYVSKPTLLHGMTLYPETIGYVRPDIPRPVDEMRHAFDEVLLVRESMIGAFYHPYIGTEHLDEVVDLMESAPGFSWLDLRTTGERVSTDDISIQAIDGEFVLQDDRNTLLERLRFLVPGSFLERALAILALITLIAVTAFFTYTIYLRSQRKKRLFKERG